MYVFLQNDFQIIIHFVIFFLIFREQFSAGNLSFVHFFYFSSIFFLIHMFTTINTGSTFDIIAIIIIIIIIVNMKHHSSFCFCFRNIIINQWWWWWWWISTTMDFIVKKKEEKWKFVLFHKHNLRVSSLKKKRGFKRRKKKKRIHPVCVCVSFIHVFFPFDEDDDDDVYLDSPEFNLILDIFFLARHLLFLIKACILYSVCVCLYVLHTVTLYVDLWDDNYLWWIDVFFHE